MRSDAPRAASVFVAEYRFTEALPCPVSVACRIPRTWDRCPDEARGVRVPPVGPVGKGRLLEESDMRDFIARRDRALRLLEKTGMAKSSYCPAWLGLAWRCGLRWRPPHFAGFLPTALANGFYFAVVWGTIMWVFSWRAERMPLSQVLLFAAMAGALFGLGMATAYAQARRKHRLPTWQGLEGSQSD